MTKKKALVVEAHSDDSAISATGFLKYLKENDYEIEFFLAAVSTMSLHHSGILSREIRMNEYRNFVKEIGGIWNEEKFPPLDSESYLDTVPRAKIVKLVEDVISSSQPNLMILQGPSFHHDHTILYEAAIAATRPTARHIPDQVYIMENPTYVHSVGPTTDFQPSFYYTMTAKEINDKLECFRRCFPSQIRESGNYLSSEGIKAWSRYRGIEARADYAEAFKIYRFVI